MENVRIIKKEDNKREGTDKEENKNTELQQKCNTQKLAHYYLTSQGLLIQNLATKIAGIPEGNVKTFGYGEKEDFEVCKFTKNKSIIQLGYEKIASEDSSETPKYETKIFITRDEVRETNFTYFEYYLELYPEVLSIINGHTNSRIYLFLADLGKSQITYLQIYTTLLLAHPKTIRIFNDSCQSQNMLFYIKIFNDLIDRVIISGLDQENVISIIKQLIPIFDIAISSGENSDKAFDHVKRCLELLQKISKKKLWIIKIFIKFYDAACEIEEYKRILREPNNPIEALYQIPIKGVLG